MHIGSHSVARNDHARWRFDGGSLDFATAVEDGNQLFKSDRCRSSETSIGRWRASVACISPKVARKQAAYMCGHDLLKLQSRQRSLDQIGGGAGYEDCNALDRVRCARIRCSSTRRCDQTAREARVHTQEFQGHRRPVLCSMRELDRELKKSPRRI